MLTSTPLHIVNRCCSGFPVSSGIIMSGPLTFLVFGATLYFQISDTISNMLIYANIFTGEVRSDTALIEPVNTFISGH